MKAAIFDGRLMPDGSHLRIEDVPRPRTRLFWQRKRRRRKGLPRVFYRGRHCSRTPWHLSASQLCPHGVPSALCAPMLGEEGRRSSASPYFSRAAHRAAPHSEVRRECLSMAFSSQKTAHPELGMRFVRPLSILASILAAGDFQSQRSMEACSWGRMISISWSRAAFWPCP